MIQFAKPPAKEDNSKHQQFVDSIFFYQIQILGTLKLAHYNTTSGTNHEAYGKVFDNVVSLFDEITEQALGYCSFVGDNIKLSTGCQCEIKFDPDVKYIPQMITTAAAYISTTADELGCKSVSHLADELQGQSSLLYNLTTRT